MMLQCWESMPENRPSFKTLYTDTSKFIEGIAGYLEIGFNPFSGQRVYEISNTEKKDELELPVAVQVIPPSPSHSM